MAVVCLKNCQIGISLGKTYLTSIVSLWRSHSFQVIPMPAPIAKVINDDSIAYCAEEWGKYEKGRLIYSCFSILVQVSLKSRPFVFLHTFLVERRHTTAQWNFYLLANISTMTANLGKAHYHMVLLLVERSNRWKASRRLKCPFPRARTLERNQMVMTYKAYHVVLKWNWMTKSSS